MELFDPNKVELKRELPRQMQQLVDHLLASIDKQLAKVFEGLQQQRDQCNEYQTRQQYFLDSTEECRERILQIDQMFGRFILSPNPKNDKLCP